MGKRERNNKLGCRKLHFSVCMWCTSARCSERLLVFLNVTLHCGNEPWRQWWSITFGRSLATTQISVHDWENTYVQTFFVLVNEINTASHRIHTSDPSWLYLFRYVGCQSVRLHAQLSRIAAIVRLCHSIRQLQLSDYTCRRENWIIGLEHVIPRYARWCCIHFNSW